MVEISSAPSTASVYLNEVEIGKTPVYKNLKRNQEYRLTLKLDGYQTYETKLTRKFNAWYIGNVAFGGLIGLIVDPATGAINKLKPIEVNGVPQKGTLYHTKSGTLYIKISMEGTESTEKIGQLEKL